MASASQRVDLSRQGVRVFVGLLLTLLGAAGEVGPIPAAAAERSFRLGEIAARQIMTPIALTVPDPGRTEIMRKEESDRQLPFFRFHATAAEEVEAAFRTAFSETRDRFWDALERRFGKRVLEAKILAEPRFKDFAEIFRQQNKTFPLTQRLAEIWAQGESDLTLQSQFALRLREAMSRLIRDDSIPGGPAAVASSVRIVGVRNLSDSLDLAAAERQVRTVPMTNLILLAKARADLLRRLSAEDPLAVTYLVSILKANCAFDEDLTREQRAKATESLTAFDPYTAGQVIVKKGEIIEARTWRALEELRKKSPETIGDSLDWLPWLIGQPITPLTVGLHLAAVGGFGFWWWHDRRRRLRIAALGWSVTPNSRRTGPAPATASPALSVSFDTGDGSGWRERALVAEDRAEKATAMLREGLMPHLARWMMTELVQKLLSQRKQLTNHQELAAREMEKFEQRLEQIQAPLVDRLQAYEDRIRDLEKALEMKSQENRTLLEAQITIARLRLESERQQAVSH